jgi:GTP-binding protein EngB required for normal cell division
MFKEKIEYSRSIHTISDMGGESIQTTVQNSWFGKVKSAIKDLFGDKHVDYKLPSIICVGGESSGKSSVLENITKCRLFPRNISMCTKCPIHVIINDGSGKLSVTILGKKIICKNDAEIYNEVEKYFKYLSDDSVHEEEITINISCKGLPHLEFYDLPGLRTYPPEAAEKTVSLTKKYLNKKNSIIICTVPASTTRLTTCQAIALINDMKLQDSSIVALTMCDRVGPDEVEELIIDRIMGKSKEITDLKYAGYVGVINRSNKDRISLDDVGKVEVDWLTKNVLSVASKELDFNELSMNKLKDHLSIHNLIKNTDNLYNRYIDEKWVPNVHEKIKKEISDVENMIESLGPLMSIEDLNELLVEVFMYDGVVLKEILEIFDCRWLLKYNHVIHQYDIADIDVFGSEKHMGLLCDWVLERFNENCECDIHIERYTNAEITIRKQFINHAIDIYKETYDINLQKINNALELRSILQLPITENTLILNSIAELFIGKILDNSFTPKFSEADIIENEEYQTKRASLNKQLDELNTHLNLIKKFKESV